MFETITVTLEELNSTTQYTDPFNKSASSKYTDPVEVKGVLVYPTSSTDVLNELNLSGKRISYDILIPKGDAHNWTGALVGFFNHKWQVVGIPQEYIEKNVPGKWNKKAQVEYIE